MSTPCPRCGAPMMELFRGDTGERIGRLCTACEYKNWTDRVVPGVPDPQPIGTADIDG